MLESSHTTTGMKQHMQNSKKTADTLHPIYNAIRARKSIGTVTQQAPSSAEIARLLGAMSSVADHSTLRPWRIIELRGTARMTLAEGLAAAAGTKIESFVNKTHRAPLILTVVCKPKHDSKIPVWEQEAVASGVAHYLLLLLQEAGWGAMWRTGPYTRKKKVRKCLGVKKSELVMGFIYVGGLEKKKHGKKPRAVLDTAKFLTAL